MLGCPRILNALLCDPHNWKQSFFGGGVRSLRGFLSCRVLNPVSQLENLCSHGIAWMCCAVEGCLLWCCWQCPAQLGSSQERGSELADQQTRCAASAGAGMPMLQWLLSTSNRWWQDPSFFGDKLAKWFMEPHLMMAVFWAWLYECTICLLWTSVVRIQCLADGKLITYRVALASLSVLEFISKPWKFEQPDLSPTQAYFCYLQMRLSGGQHSSPQHSSTAKPLWIAGISQSFPDHLNSSPDREGFKYCGWQQYLHKWF